MFFRGFALMMSPYNELLEKSLKIFFLEIFEPPKFQLKKSQNFKINFFPQKLCFKF